MAQQDYDYDVAILGSGIAGSVLAAVLARQGFRTLLLERNSHPRFAIGESLLPQSSMHFKIIGARFDVPEIGHLGNLKEIEQHISRRCGLKRSLGFVYHSEGQPHNPETCHLVVPPETPLTTESHLFREDVDLYLVDLARQYGVDYRDHTEVEDVHPEEDRVRLTLQGDSEIAVRYLVDASGYNSPLARKMNMRRPPDGLKTRSRSIFTHMKNVPHYSNLLKPDENPKVSARWHDGTLHHIFDGGWMWVIPFNNHETAENQLCSVGLTLDMDKFPATGRDPEEEFREIIGRFPDVARHFKEAEPVRKWVSTGRLQYGATRATGHRYCLMAHAYGFIDPLYSRGLVSTAEVINALAGRLIDALRADDFSEKRFDYIDRLQKASLEANDRMVHSSYVAFRDFSLWNAWIRFWVTSKIFGDVRLYAAWLAYSNSGDTKFLDALENDPAPGTACPSVEEVQAFLSRGFDTMQQVADGKLATAAGIAALTRLLKEDPVIPPNSNWGNFKIRHMDFDANVMRDLIIWGKMKSPRKIRSRLFAFNPAPLMAASMPRAAAVVIGGLLTAVGRLFGARRMA